MLTISPTTGPGVCCVVSVTDRAPRGRPARRMRLKPCVHVQERIQTKRNKLCTRALPPRGTYALRPTAYGYAHAPLRLTVSQKVPTHTHTPLSPTRPRGAVAPRAAPDLRWPRGGPRPQCAPSEPVSPRMPRPARPAAAPPLHSAAARAAARAVPARATARRRRGRLGHGRLRLRRRWRRRQRGRRRLGRWWRRQRPRDGDGAGGAVVAGEGGEGGDEDGGGGEGGEGAGARRCGRRRRRNRCGGRGGERKRRGKVGATRRTAVAPPLVASPAAPPLEKITEK